MPHVEGVWENPLIVLHRSDVFYVVNLFGFRKEDGTRRFTIALKAIAKTLSMTLKIAQTAHEKGVPCFCADLTGNPILVDWNKAVAARLAPFPDLDLGLLETNGHQNYKNWETMTRYHPCAGASWTKMVDGVFNLEQEYYKKSGGILQPSKHYEDMFKHRK